MNDHRVRVLLIEDDEVDAARVQKAFDGIDPPIFQVDWVTRLSWAAERIEKHPFNVILLDLGLPDSSGLKTLASVAELASETPLIVLTGVNNEEVAEQALKMGAQAFMRKDHINSEALISTLRSAIRRQRRGGADDSVSLSRERLDQFCDEVHDSVTSIAKASDFLANLRLDAAHRDAVALIRSRSNTTLQAVNRFRQAGQTKH